MAIASSTREGRYRISQHVRTRSPRCSPRPLPSRQAFRMSLPAGRGLTTDDSREEPAKPGLELRVRVVSGNQTIAGLAGEIHRILVCRLVVR
jgi:hypothetical protein